MYGSYEPTAVYVPLKHFRSAKKFSLISRELFGPFQVITDYNMNSIGTVINSLERMDNHLTAAVVSNDTLFTQNILGNSINGTTYIGRRARTTGAPQNHWFGPAGDPRGAGIGSKEAIQMVWSCHREIIKDEVVPEGWTMPPPS
jgi:1-pyrroline-5-carboxylate dehydrogenase